MRTQHITWDLSITSNTMFKTQHHLPGSLSDYNQEEQGVTQHFIKCMISLSNLRNKNVSKIKIKKMFHVRNPGSTLEILRSSAKFRKVML